VAPDTAKLFQGCVLLTLHSSSGHGVYLGPSGYDGTAIACKITRVNSSEAVVYTYKQKPLIRQERNRATSIYTTTDDLRLISGTSMRPKKSVAPPDSIVGLNLKEFVSQSDLSQVRCAVKYAIETGQPCVTKTVFHFNGQSGVFHSAVSRTGKHTIEAVNFRVSECRIAKYERQVYR